MLENVRKSSYRLGIFIKRFWLLLVWIFHGIDYKKTPKTTMAILNRQTAQTYIVESKSSRNFVQWQSPCTRSLLLSYWLAKNRFTSYNARASTLLAWTCAWRFLSLLLRLKTLLKGEQFAGAEVKQNVKKRLEEL